MLLEFQFCKCDIFVLLKDISSPQFNQLIPKGRSFTGYQIFKMWPDMWFNRGTIDKPSRRLSEWFTLKKVYARGKLRWRAKYEKYQSVTVLDINAINRHFDIKNAIPKKLSEVEFYVLMSEEKIFVTDAILTDKQAEHYIGKAPVDEPYPPKGVYMGYLIVESSASFSDAERWCSIRGFNEQNPRVFIEEIPEKYNSIITKN